MTICEFMETLNDNFNTVFTLFDCNSSEVIFVATEEAENALELSRDELLYSDYADYEIASIDMWIDKGRIHIEFNIEIEEEEF